TRRHLDLEAGARWHGAVAAALDDADVEEGITAARQLDKAEALLRVIPFDRGLHRRAVRSGLERAVALTRRIPKVGGRRVVVVIEASPLRSPEISVFAHALLDPR